MGGSDRLKLSLVLIGLQVLFIVLFVALVEYDDAASPAPVIDANSTAEDKKKAANALKPNPLGHYYPMFQDVHVMIFIGFGFLMVFLRRYGFSSVGLNMLLSVVAIQWATIVGGLIHHKGEKFQMGVTSMLTADFACAAVLITFGALLGKTSPLQMVVITLLEIVIFSANEYIGVTVLKAVDVGGSMFVHAFGAYFGLTVSRVLFREGMDSSPKEGSVYHSDLFAMIGSVFLWMFWPSFNSALAEGDAQHRAVLNTYLALAACCVVSFAVSSLVDKHGKFDMVHVQNATLAGGVAVGTSADMMIEPHGALIVGAVAGCLSVIGYKYVTPFLSSKLKIHDTCGVNNLHGMPAIMAGITGAIVVTMADADKYGSTLFRQFPAMDTKEDGRSASKQASFQILALVVTLAFAVVGGLIVGLILRVCTFLGQPIGEHLFEDSPYWEVPEDPESGEIVNDVLCALEKRNGGKGRKSNPDIGMAPLLNDDGAGSNYNTVTA